MIDKNNEIILLKESELILVKRLPDDLAINENLTIKDVKNSCLLSSLSKDVVIASKCYPKIGTRKNELFFTEDGKPIEVRQYEIRQHISIAMFDAGLTGSLEVTDVKKITDTVVVDVIDNYPQLTTQEVGIAFKKGAREDYGEIYGLSPRTFYKWLKCYCEQTKIQANKEFAKLDIEPIKELTEEEKNKKHKKWLLSFCKDYDVYCKTGEYDTYDLMNLFYKHLFDKKLLVLTNPEMLAIYKQAETNLRLRYNPKNANNMFQRNSFFELIEKLNKKDLSMEEEIKNEARQISIKYYFDKLKGEGKSLKTILNL